MTFLKEKIFAPDAFDLPADLLNKLQPERFPDFNWSVYYMYQVDYPIHAVVLAYQNLALSRLYSAHILGRLVNNLERYQPDDDRYTMYDMFKEVRNSIWSEMDTPKNVNSFRRQLQLIHLKRLIALYLSSTSTYPSDARTLAGNDLDILERNAKQALKATSVDNMSKAHFKEVLRQIESAKGAKRDYAKR